MLAAVRELAATMHTQGACEVLGLSRATYYRLEHPQPRIIRPRREPAWTLTPEERAAVLALLHSEDYVDMAPPEIVATLLDRGVYLCSERTMYRLLAAEDEVRERRAVARHGKYKAPELLATRPNMVWSWDVTKLKGPGKWTYYYLYVILDIFSRLVTGWTVAERESEALARELIAQACALHGIEPGQLGLHADNGAAMTSKAVSQLLLDLGVERTHNRPYKSNDNPYSESQFKTLKYRPDFPERFGCKQDAAVFLNPFFGWYNNHHRHSGICMLTPAMVHCGRAEEVLERRYQVMLEAYRKHPERFSRAPRRRHLPKEVWINQPNTRSQTT